MGDCASAGDGAVVVPFARKQSHPQRLNVSERIEAIQWADAARPHGFRALRIHEPERGDDPALGPFVLIYEQHDIWAGWGIAVRAGSFEVWRPSSGTTVGYYRSLREALRAIKDVG